MTQVVIIINEDGSYDSAYSDSEIDFKVLKRGSDDAIIDKTEETLEEIE